MSEHDDEYGPKSHPTGRLPAVRAPAHGGTEIENEDEIETKVICPACRALMDSCRVCSGKGSLTTKEYAEWRLSTRDA